MDRAVSNASPLIHLSLIGRIDLLRCYSSIIIPSAVWREVVEEGGMRPGVKEIRKLHDEGLLSIMEPSNSALVQLLEQDLHSGEAESIALALEVRPDILLLDESEARRIAGSYGIPVTGTLGILIRASRDGQITSLEQEMSTLRCLGHFWIHDTLYQRILDEEVKRRRKKSY